MNLITAFILATAAVLVLDKIIRTVYRAHRWLEGKRFERWLERHPQY